MGVVFVLDGEGAVERDGEAPNKDAKSVDSMSTRAGCLSVGEG